MARTGFGLRVAHWRTLADISQEELGRRAGGYSKQYISAIENGRRQVGTLRLVADLAHGLGIEIHHLLGQPYAPTNETDLLNYTIVPLIRTALDEPDQEIEIRDMRQLELAAARAMAARMACDMTAIGETLPGLLAEARQQWYATGDGAAGLVFVKALVTGALAFKAAGHIDLAIRMAEQADHVATGIGHPIAVAAARFTTAQCAMSTGNRKRSARLADQGATELDRYVRTPKLANMLHNDALGWMVMLHLQAALSEAGMTGGDPSGRLAAAEVVARHVDGNPWLMEPTIANVETWGVGVALENGQPERAPDLARRIDVNALLTPQRRSRVHLDWGRGLFLTEDYAGATRQLLIAEENAPGDLRNRATAVEAVVYMIRHQRVGSEELANLAVKVGVDPAAVLAGD
jgi:transcriptional regulator with XRE-family HTH domain